ncbi:hypothetical protein LTS17_004677 [Exophiala oligosperma]
MDYNRFNHQVGRPSRMANTYNPDNSQSFPATSSHHAFNMLPSNGMADVYHEPTNPFPPTMTNNVAPGYICNPHLPTAPLSDSDYDGFQGAFCQYKNDSVQGDAMTALQQRIATLEQDNNHLRALNDRLLREGRTISHRYAQMRNFFAFEVTNGGIQPINPHNPQYQQSAGILRRCDYLIAYYQGLKARINGDNNRNSTIPDNSPSQYFEVGLRHPNIQRQQQPTEIVDLTSVDDDVVAQDHFKNVTCLEGGHVPTGQIVGQAAPVSAPAAALQQANNTRCQRRRSRSESAEQTETSPATSSTNPTTSPLVSSTPEFSPPQVPDAGTSPPPPKKRATAAEFWAKTERWQGPLANLHLAKALGMKPSPEYAREISNRRDRDSLDLNIRMSERKKKESGWDTAASKRSSAAQKGAIAKPSVKEGAAVKGKSREKVAPKKTSGLTSALPQPIDEASSKADEDSSDLEACFEEYFRDEDAADVEDNEEGGCSIHSISPLAIEDGDGRPLPDYQEPADHQEDVGDGLDYLF